ncbi:MAG: PP0621 family protein, partial [Usitatibacter sp.]
ARILFLLVIVFLLYLLLRRFFRSQTKDAPPPAATQVKGEDMVACARCGVNLPRSDVREEAGRLVCQNNPHCHP